MEFSKRANEQHITWYCILRFLIPSHLPLGIAWNCMVLSCIDTIEVILSDRWLLLGWVKISKSGCLNELTLEQCDYNMVQYKNWNMAHLWIYDHEILIASYGMVISFMSYYLPPFEVREKLVLWFPPSISRSLPLLFLAIHVRTFTKVS